MIGILKLVVRNLRRAKLRNTLLALCIMVGVGLTIAVNVSFDNALNAFCDILYKSFGAADVVITRSDMQPVPEALVDQVSKAPHVKWAAGRIAQPIEIFLPNGSRYPDIGLLQGYDVETDPDYRDPAFFCIDGTRDLGPGEAVVANTVWNRLGAVIQVRQPWRRKAPLINLTIVGILELSEAESFYMSGAVIVDLDYAQEVLDYGESVDYIAIRVDDVRNINAVVEWLRERLGDEYEVTNTREAIQQRLQVAIAAFRFALNTLSIATLAVSAVLVFASIHLSVKRRTMEIGILRSIGASRSTIAGLFLGEAVLVGLIGSLLGLPFAIAMTRFVTEWGMRIFAGFGLREIVWTPQWFMLGLSLGIVFAICGAAAPSYWASRIQIVEALSPGARRGGIGERRGMLLLVGGLITAICSIAYQVLRLITVPVEEGSITVFTGIGYMRYLLVIGTAIGVAVLLVGVLTYAQRFLTSLLRPTLGGLARAGASSIWRHLARSVVLILIVALPLLPTTGMSLTVYGMREGVLGVIRNIFGSDIAVIVHGGTNYTIDTELALAVKGVADASALYIIPSFGARNYIRAGDGREYLVTVAVIKPESLLKVLHVEVGGGRDPEYIAQRLRREPGIMITSWLAEEMGVGENDTIQIVLEGAKRWHNATVVGVGIGAAAEMLIIGRVAIRESIMISYDFYQNLTNTPTEELLANVVFVRVATGEDVDVVKQRILDYMEAKGLDADAFSITDVEEIAESEVQRAIMLIHLLLAVAMLASSIGVFAIAMLDLEEQRRELAILRALGADARRASVYALSRVLILGIGGVLLGAAMGTYAFFWLTQDVQAAFPLPFVTPLEAYAEVLPFGFVALLIACIYPLHRATRLNVVDALRRE